MSMRDVGIQGSSINVDKQDVGGKEWRMERNWLESLMCEGRDWMMGWRWKSTKVEGSNNGAARVIGFVAPFINSLVMPLCRVFTNICSLLIEKDSHASRNTSIKFPCVVRSAPVL